MVAGDINEIRFDWEASGRGIRDRGGMNRFNDTIEQCGLFDLGFSGSIYTFTNKQKGPLESRARLDRALGNLEMKTLAPKLVIHHVLGLRSDHSPLVIKLSGNLQNRRPKQFTFEIMWQRHPDFKELVTREWREAAATNLKISDTLAQCAMKFGNWNRNTFGHVQEKIKGLKNKLSDVKGKERTDYTTAQEKDLSDELDEWLAREEYIWRHRSMLEPLTGSQSIKLKNSSKMVLRFEIFRAYRLELKGFKSRRGEANHGDWSNIIPSIVTDEVEMKLRRIRWFNSGCF